MNQDNSANDVLNYNENLTPQASTGLKALTILTFIGSSLQLIGGVWNFFSIQRSYEGLDKLVEQMNSDAMPAWAKSMLGDPAHIVELITKSYLNRIPIVLLTLVAVALCFIGAVQMRKLKKQGFLFYVIGELLPYLTTFIFIGAFSLSGIFFFIGVFISLLFILLYALQRKQLVY